MSLLLLEKQGHIATLTLNRPETMNALGMEGDAEAVEEACAAINSDRQIRCVILTGAGRAFSAGGDVKAMKNKTGYFGGTGVDIREGYRRGIHRVARALYHIDVPMIAAVNGPAIGLGCDIACMADIRISSDQARYGVTFLRLGIIPGDGGTWLLPRTIGMTRASELFFTADVVDAQTACDWGLVSRVVPHAQLMDEARALAQRICVQPPHSLRLTKQMLRQGQMISYDLALDIAASNQAISHLTQDHAEGVDALLEKRAPSFKGK